MPSAEIRSRIEMRMPNATTRAAMQEGRRTRTRYESVTDLVDGIKPKTGRAANKKRKFKAVR